jgi:hypothetical protein
VSRWILAFPIVLVVGFFSFVGLIVYWAQQTRHLPEHVVRAQTVEAQPPNFQVIRSAGTMYVRVFDHDGDRCYVVEHRIHGQTHGLTVSISCLKR